MGVLLNNVIDFVYNEIVNLDLHCTRRVRPIAYEKLTCVKTSCTTDYFFSVVLVVKQISLFVQQGMLLGDLGKNTNSGSFSFAVIS